MSVEEPDILIIVDCLRRQIAEIDAVSTIFDDTFTVDQSKYCIVNRYINDTLECRCKPRSHSPLRETLTQNPHTIYNLPLLTCSIEVISTPSGPITLDITLPQLYPARGPPLWGLAGPGVATLPPTLDIDQLTRTVTETLAPYTPTPSQLHTPAPGPTQGELPDGTEILSVLALAVRDELRAIVPPDLPPPPNDGDPGDQGVSQAMECNDQRVCDPVTIPHTSPQTDHSRVSHRAVCADCRRDTCPGPVFLQRGGAWSHHIIAPAKRQYILRLAAMLRLGGLVKVGWPGVVIVEGEQEAVREFWSRLQNLRWKRFVVRAEEVVRVRPVRGGEKTRVCFRTWDEAMSEMDKIRAFMDGFLEIPPTMGLGAAAERCRAVGLESLFLTTMGMKKKS